MTPLTFVSNDSTWEILFKLVAAQGGSQVPRTGDTERELLMKLLQNGGLGGGSGTGVDSTITTLAGLAAIETSALTLDSIKLFYNEDDDEVQAWQLVAGTDATVAGSIQRPDDFNDPGNARVWRRVPLV